jgi:hypothetical protein
VIANSIVATSVIMIGALFYVVGELSFLARYRDLILQRYGSVIVWFIALVFCNLCVGIHTLARKLLLKDTGKKLAHVEKQLRTGSSISEELTRLIED